MTNRTDLTPAGLVDDLVVEQATLEIKRTGDARYSFVATTPEGRTSVELWTTERVRISVRIDDGTGDEDWFNLRTDGEVLESLIATDCMVHLEQLDRGHYFLGLYRGSDQILLRLHAPGYIKARPVERGAT